MRESYETSDGIVVHGETMYIAGTRLDRLSGIRYVLDDFTLIPTRQASSTQRYQDALTALKRTSASRSWSGTRWAEQQLLRSLRRSRDYKRVSTGRRCFGAPGASG